MEAFDSIKIEGGAKVEGATFESPTQFRPRRPPAAEAKAASDEHGAARAVQAALDQQLWDVRLAAILNTMQISRDHGEHRDWTAEDAERIRAMLELVNRTVTRDSGGVVPEGFGPLIHSPIAAALIKAHQSRLDPSAPADSSVA